MIENDTEMWVPYVPGGRVYRSGISYPPVRVPARGNRRQGRHAVRKTDGDDHGVLAVLLVAAFAFFADGVALLVFAWVTR